MKYLLCLFLLIFLTPGCAIALHSPRLHGSEHVYYYSAPVYKTVKVRVYQTKHTRYVYKTPHKRKRYKKVRVYKRITHLHAPR